MNIRKIYLFSMLLCISLAVNADVYRCKGGNGQTMISTSPCGDSYSTTKVVGQESSDALALQQAQADLERQKRWLQSREREQQVSAWQYASTPATRRISGGADDHATRDRIHACLMHVTATFGLSPSQEAWRKVNCYRGTVGLQDECESRVTATSRLSSRDEQIYKAQCKSL